MSQKQQIQTAIRLPAELRALALEFCKQSRQGYNLSSLIRTALVEKIDRERSEFQPTKQEEVENA